MRYPALLIGLFLFASCTNKEDIKKEIIEEILVEMNNRNNVIKGDGSNFYGEKISIGGEIYYKHHSTLHCPGINYGVQRNWYDTWGDHNTFCHICMDDYHITQFQKKFFSKK